MYGFWSPTERSSVVAAYYACLIFDEEQLVQENMLICPSVDVAIEMVDRLYLRLHTPEGQKTYGLGPGHMPQALALRDEPGGEFLLMLELQLDATI